MKRILLTSTALVMVAGIAAADGHSSMSWSGTATAGVARIGNGEKAIAAVATTATGAQYATFTAATAGIATVSATNFAAGTRATAAEFAAARVAQTTAYITAVIAFSATLIEILASIVLPKEHVHFKGVINEVHETCDK